MKCKMSPELRQSNLRVWQGVLFYYGCMREIGPPRVCVKSCHPQAALWTTPSPPLVPFILQTGNIMEELCKGSLTRQFFSGEFVVSTPLLFPVHPRFLNFTRSKQTVDKAESSLCYTQLKLRVSCLCISSASFRRDQGLTRFFPYLPKHDGW